MSRSVSTRFPHTSLQRKRSLRGCRAPAGGALYFPDCQAAGRSPVCITYGTTPEIERWSMGRGASGRGVPTQSMGTSIVPKGVALLLASRGRRPGDRVRHVWHDAGDRAVEHGNERFPEGTDRGWLHTLLRIFCAPLCTACTFPMRGRRFSFQSCGNRREIRGLRFPSHRTVAGDAPLRNLRRTSARKGPEPGSRPRNILKNFRGGFDKTCISMQECRYSRHTVNRCASLSGATRAKK